MTNTPIPTKAERDKQELLRQRTSKKTRETLLDTYRFVKGKERFWASHCVGFIDALAQGEAERDEWESIADERQGQLESSRNQLEAERTAHRETEAERDKLKEVFENAQEREQGYKEMAQDLIRRRDAAQELLKQAQEDQRIRGSLTPQVVKRINALLAPDKGEGEKRHKFFPVTPHLDFASLKECGLCGNVKEHPIHE